MNLSAALTQFLYAKDYTPKSRRWMTQKLEAFVAWCAASGILDTTALTRQHIRQFIHTVRETPSATTGDPIASSSLHGYMRALKGFLRWCVEEEWLDAKVVRHLEMPRVEQKVIATFTKRHIEVLFRACDSGAESPQQAARDKAIVAVLLDTGVRANELCSLTLDRVHLTQHDAYAIVDGKGRKQREVSLGMKARQLLHRYIHQYRDAYRPAFDERHVFLAKGATPLTPTGLARLLGSLRERGRITDIQVNAHRFRHTYAVTFMEQNHDVLRLSRTLGHTSLAVTDNYLRAFTSRSARQGKSVLDNLA
jgi:integrase/recombinase XerD